MIETALGMEFWTIVTFMGASMLLYLTPGADMMFTIASGVSGGPRAGVAAACGISLGVLVHVMMAAAGLAALVAASPATLDVVRYAGAAYLAWLAWKAWTDTGALPERAGRADILRAFRRGFVTNILNPKVGLFVLAFLPQFADPAIGPVWHQIIILGSLLTLGGVVTDGLYGIFAGLLAARVRRNARRMNRISAVIFGGLAARLAVN
ncbi:LysE family translocator [Puniceibacterium sp. IMCC21224]|uniref:LysE family translocator n=1 Tax=Puniceibacterium sp. IMCC21224 TaxID=1618204 RepID=UPI00064DFF83|nr:LysE family translocator [Puniceibacterium sp. IMCC21224]KMK68719.1 putative threonine efflux protein [Puniceibacterium sp. IMCC21224]